MILYVVAIILAGFVALGFWRGWLREASALAGLLVIWSLLLVVGQALIGSVNRLFLILAFTVRGGFDSPSPGAVIEELRRAPLVDSRHSDVVNAVLFVVLVGVIYVASQRFVAPVSTLGGRLLGGLVGLAEGYLLVYLALRFVAPIAGLGVPRWAGVALITNLLERNLSTLLIVGVALIVGIALLSTSRAPSRGRGRPSPSRPRGRASEAS